MKKISLLVTLLVVIAFALSQAATLTKVSPAQGSTVGDPIYASSGSRVVQIKADGPVGTTITVSSDNPSAISVTPASQNTGADSTTSFSVNFGQADTTEATATLTFESGADVLPVYAKKAKTNIKVPSLTTYGFIALALLLAGTAVWMFRRRGVSVA